MTRSASKLCPPCLVEGVEKPATENGMCKKHSTRVRRHGDPFAFTHQRDRDYPRGSAHHSWTGDQVTYDDMHRRVVRAMGSASEHPCTDCGNPAKHWSYDHKDPDERLGDKGAFSLDINHYLPRCVSCHKRFDLALKPIRRKPIDLDEVRRLHAAGVRVRHMTAMLGVGTLRINRALDELGLPRFRPGHISSTNQYQQGTSPIGGAA